MARLRYNGLTATLAAPLAAGDTTITFAAALSSASGAVPTIGAGDSIALSVLNASGAVTEIVSLTAYTSGATTGTIARAQEGTAAVAHASGDAVVHGPTAADFGSSVAAMTEVIKSADQALTVSAYTTLTWATEVVDDLGAFNSATSTSRLVAPTTGLYEVTCRVAFEGGTANTARTINLRKNGADLFGRECHYPPLLFEDFALSRTVKLAAGDYVEAQAYSEGTDSYAKALRFGNSGSIFTMVRLG